MRKCLKHAAANILLQKRCKILHINGFGMNKSDFAMLHKRKELTRAFHYLYRFKTLMLKLKLFKGEISIDCNQNK